MISRFRLVVSESLRSLGANLSTTVAATMTVLIAMCLLGLFIALGTWVLSWSDHLKSELKVKVYFCVRYAEGCRKDVTAAQINAVRKELIAMQPMVKDITFISQADALKIMRKRSPELFTTALPSNPLPASYEVTADRGEDVPVIAKRLGTPPGVDKVSYGDKTAHRVLRVAKVIWLVFLVAVSVLLVSSTLLIANTIRLSIFSRRREIEVMKLVGATNWFVRGPFMLEGLLCGLAGAVAAIILLVLAKELALPAILGHINTGSDVHAISFSLNALILIGSGLLLGAAGSGVTLRRFLKV